MKPSLATKSILLFLLSILFLILLTVFEASLSGLSLMAERILSAVLLVLPGVIGLMLGIMSLVRKESKRWVAFLGIFLNAVFALFHIFVISFAG